MENFYLTVNTEIIWDNSTESIPEIIRRKVEKRWKRHLEMTFNRRKPATRNILLENRKKYTSDRSRR